MRSERRDERKVGRSDAHVWQAGEPDFERTDFSDVLASLTDEKPLVMFDATFVEEAGEIEIMLTLNPAPQRGADDQTAVLASAARKLDPHPFSTTTMFPLV